MTFLESNNRYLANTHWPTALGYYASNTRLEIRNVLKKLIKTLETTVRQKLL